MKHNKILFISLVLSLINNVQVFGQHSVARKWNEILLKAIQNDKARPTVHARNLFHTSVLMYDSWAVYDPVANTYFLGKNWDGFQIPFTGITDPVDRKKAVETTLSYASYKLIKHRFANSPKVANTFYLADSLMLALGYDKNFTSQSYELGDYAALGNYMANQMISFGLQDGSNEQNDYANLYYKPQNAGLDPRKKGNTSMMYPNNWQPLIFDVFIDQSGNEIPGSIPKFLSPEWGNVIPFALDSVDLSVKTRADNQYNVYHDPGIPAQLGTGGIEDEYKWSFLLVSMWSSHLHPSDSVKIDISPNGQGNYLESFGNLTDIRTFYRDSMGGDVSKGYNLNPVTSMPYAPNIVYRGDFTRVLAEFWADGPSSETPPGHWFSILNYVSDHPSFVKKYKGTGAVLDDLEWDVKTYFSLGGAMHDCAVSCWGIKGYYDYTRPISAIRYMVGKGQSTDPNLSNYSPSGIPLVEGFSEVVQIGDPLAGANDANVGKIKLYAWKGHRFISHPLTDDAGVGWILGEDWTPYQRQTFVTPPFAGYVSGHSTYSRAAADVLTELTGSPYFPDGLGEFVAEKNKFLVFEEGPSQDVVLQWASYRDASNQTSLSRIWGGIHPPEDDIPARIIGEKIAVKAMAKANLYFDGQITSVGTQNFSVAIFPNPIHSNQLVSAQLKNNNEIQTVRIISANGNVFEVPDFKQIVNQLYFNSPILEMGTYLISIQSTSDNYTQRVLVLE